jgi:hypothetical protein
VAETHNIRLVLRHLIMDRRGCEIYIRPMSRYPRLVEQFDSRKWIPYSEVAEYVRGLGETAIGYGAPLPSAFHSAHSREIILLSTARHSYFRA